MLVRTYANIPDDEPAGWEAVTQRQYEAMTPANKRAWNEWFLAQFSGGVVGRIRNPLTATMQAEHQADHHDAINDHEMRIGQRIP